MNSTYAHVTDGTVDQVGLPESGFVTDSQGRRRGVSGFDKLPAETLAAEGWLPVVDEPPAYDAGRQALTATGYEVDGDTVRATYDVTPLPASLTADPLSISTADTSLVTYRDGTATAPATVTFTVNGATSTVALSDGTAELEVTPSAAGDIAVSVDQDVPGVTITVQEA